MHDDIIFCCQNMNSKYLHFKAKCYIARYQVTVWNGSCLIWSSDFNGNILGKYIYQAILIYWIFIKRGKWRTLGIVQNNAVVFEYGKNNKESLKGTIS